MTIRSLLLPILILLSITAHAGKLYRVLDEKGNVSFSQYPPIEKEENVTIEDIDVDGSSHSTITEGIDGRYCGKIKLLDQSSSGYSNATYMKRLDKLRSSWQRQLDQLNESMDRSNQQLIENNKNRSKKYNSYNQDYQSRQNRRYQETITDNTQKLRDLHCALSWTDKESRGASDYIANNKLERERLIKVRDELKTNLLANCGEIPVYDPSAGRNDAVRKRWYECSDKLRREIDLLQREISKL